MRERIPSKPDAIEFGWVHLIPTAAFKDVLGYQCRWVAGAEYSKPGLRNRSRPGLRVLSPGHPVASGLRVLSPATHVCVRGFEYSAPATLLRPGFEYSAPATLCRPGFEYSAPATLSPSGASSTQPGHPVSGLIK